MIDIDRFKAINDQFGHHAGDQAIKEIAATCMKNKRGPDIVARIGGDEFAVLLPETDLQQAQAVAQRLRALIAQAREPGDSAASRVDKTVSIGIAAATLSMSGIGTLIRLADKALYEAKTAGRNCIRSAKEPRPQHFLALSTGWPDAWTTCPAPERGPGTRQAGPPAKTLVAAIDERERGPLVSWRAGWSAPARER